MRIIAHSLVVVLLTVLTQLGGIAWLFSRLTPRPGLSFLAIYAGFVALAWVAAPMAGRVPIPCWGEPLRMQSPLYCGLMRNYVVPDLAEMAGDAAAALADQHPGTITLALDGGFPFLTGFPLLPHLSHDDGEKLDFAFFYTNGDGRYLPGRTRSPIGYFAFETLGEGACPRAIPTLRWNLRALQPWFPDRRLEPERTRALIRLLLDDPRSGRMFLEPALADRLNLEHPDLRFQGCRAARHDDHLHVELHRN